MSDRWRFRLAKVGVVALAAALSAVLYTTGDNTKPHNAPVYKTPVFARSCGHGCKVVVASYGGGGATIGLFFTQEKDGWRFQTAERMDGAAPAVPCDAGC